uniref:Si:dkeyp-93d12.1 n=1 Tax=Echeneis naucrates TaxID=173247 RepID=A0A665V499_ECHNA
SSLIIGLLYSLTHLDWNPEATLIHFQGQYLTICELDYKILQGEIQNIIKTKAAVDVGEFCLVEDLTSARWYRGRVQNQKEDVFDVFLIDYGNVLSVDIAHISSCSNDLLILPPKIVCGFLANVLLHQDSHSDVEQYLESLIGKNVTGYIQALLPHKVLLLEAPDINNDLVRHGFGRHVDTVTFLFLVEMLTEFCFKQSGLQGYKDMLSFFGPRLNCGIPTKVRVTAAVNPGLFYCQLASMETELWEMSKKLAAVCEKRTKTCNQKTSENLGLLCSVKGKDGKWYRGFVQFLPMNSQVRVMFIDYGFFESVKVEDVHRLPFNLYSAPIMAFPCMLSSLSDPDEAVKNQQLSLLKAGLLGGVLEMEIASFDDERHLYSVTLIGTEDDHVKEPEPIKKIQRTEVKTEQPCSPGGYLRHETIVDKASGKAQEAEELRLGSVFVGYAEHVQNPYHFWIRTQRRNDEFEEMMTKITDHFSQVKLDEDVLPNPEVGTLCCALYEEDRYFYRAVVTNTLQHGAEVLFIDFGNTEKVPHMLIKKIPEEFASKSPFAFCCALVNILPLDEVWNSTTSDFFRQAVSDKALLVRVVQQRRNKFIVDLSEMGSDDNQSITDLLISSKQAEAWNNISAQPVVQYNTKAKEKPSCPMYNVKHYTDGTTEKADDNVFEALSIKPGCEFAVHCSCINSPSDFWCQRQDRVQALEELMDKIQQFYSTNTVPLQPGTSCCVAKSPEDGKWYRASIIAKQKSDARVILVDYGFIFNVKDHNLQSITPEYVNLEKQAFRCSFSNLIEPADSENYEDWSPEACSSLKSFILQSIHSLRCKVISKLNVKNKGLCNTVDLFNTQTQQSMPNLLLEQGLAREAKVLTKQLSTISPVSFVYSSYDLSPGSEKQVFVTHVCSQWEIYCHLEENTQIIEELERKIIKERVKMMQANKSDVVRKLCLAKYLDGRWYRGLALPVQSPLHLSVFFVDYGNTNISEKSHIMFIPRDSDDLLYTPMQAVRCCLASVSKEELYADAKDWLNKATLNKQVKAVILGKNEDGSFDVELFDGDVNINEKVKELIVSLSPKQKTVVSFETRNRKKKPQALHTTTNISVKSSQRKVPSSNSCRDTYAGKAPEKEKQKTKLSVRCKTQSKNMKVTQKEEKMRSCVPLRSSKNSEVKRQEHQDTNTKSEQPSQSNKEEIPQLWCSADKVNECLKAKCFISHVESACNFFLHLSEDEPAILKMAESLNSGIIKNSLKAATSVTVSDLVLAEYEEDGALYRCVVKDYEGNSCFKVEYIDYGNSAVVGKENIFFIPKEYYSQSRFSIPCSLLDTSTYENDASFTDAVMEKPLMVDFVQQRGSQWEVKVEIFDLDCRRRLSTNTSHSKRNQRKPSVSPVKRISGHTNGFINLTIQAKDRQRGTLLSVQSNGDFYVRLARTSSLLAALESGIAENLHKCKMVVKEDVKQGVKCLVQVHMDRWQRAVVQDVAGEKCKVLLVDHGVTEEVPTDLVRLQCADLTKIQNLAVLCRMNCVGFREGEDAHRLRCESLQTLIGNEISLVFVSYSEVDNVWTVEMIKNGLFHIHQAAALLHQKEEVIPSLTETQNEATKEKPSWDTDPPQRLSFAPVDMDKVYLGVAAAVTNPFEFSVVLDDFLLIMNKVSILLDDLCEQTAPLPEAHLVHGSCCLFKPDSKRKWCRSEIVHADTTVVLNLVDYGHYERIPYKDRSKLQRPPEELMTLPKVIYPCVLRGVKPAGEDELWTDEAAVLFQRCLYQKDLQIFFREFVSNAHWKVDILADGVHVAKKLVDAGHASYIDLILELRYASICIHHFFNPFLEIGFCWN